MSLYDPRRPTRERIWTVEDFFTPDECRAVIARAAATGFGEALFFFHPILHEGRMVERGVKHVLRSDVMYRRPR